MIDRYYTPESVAETVAAQVPRSANGCADVACGRGALLLAAEDRRPGIQCVGIDSDPVAVRHLRRLRPEWTVSQGDLTCNRSMIRTAAWKLRDRVEVLLLNPPFSMGASGGRPCPLVTGSPRTSAAMGFLIAAIGHVQPERTVALVPESLCSSDLDRRARAHLGRAWRVSVVASFDHRQFPGAAARTLLLEMVRRERRSRGAADWMSHRSWPFSDSVRLLRGNVPVYRTSSMGDRVPFVHSTDLVDMANGATPSDRHISMDAPRTLRGSCVLVPRVGAPTRSHVVVYSSKASVTLSDCVIALRVASADAATQLREHIMSHWPSFLELYQGTGARYTTVSRLAKWAGAAVQVRD